MVGLRTFYFRKLQTHSMNELHLFAGAGGGILGGILLGHTCVCAVEIEPYPRAVLLQRQRDGILPRFPIWDDVTTFDGKPWRGLVDVVCGGFPCQDISAAGTGAGIEGERSGLWREMERIIGEVQPRYVLVENSPMLTIRGLGRVLGGLSEMGYDAEWGTMFAADVGLPHLRERIWILAYAVQDGRIRTDESDDLRTQRKWRHPSQRRKNRELSQMGQAGYRELQQQQIRESDTSRMADGLAFTVDELAATGNGQVPSVAALAWNLLSPFANQLTPAEESNAASERQSPRQ
jgi:DNA (cytosine-5)-methyltransferase 1